MAQLPTFKDQIIAVIQRLADRVPRTRDELSVLEAESVELALHIQKRTALHDVPEHVWHFLSDADIRFKDPGYAQVQVESLREVLAHWAAER
jgi:hypothetical protein